MKKYRLEIEEYQGWFHQHHGWNGVLFTNASRVYIDSDFTSVQWGEDCVAVREIGGAIGCFAVPRRFLISVGEEK